MEKTTLREALVHSYNIPAIKVLQQVGIRPGCTSLAKNLGDQFPALPR